MFQSRSPILSLLGHLLGLPLPFLSLQLVIFERLSFLLPWHLFLLQQFFQPTSTSFSFVIWFTKHNLLCFCFVLLPSHMIVALLITLTTSSNHYHQNHQTIIINPPDLLGHHLDCIQNSGRFPFSQEAVRIAGLVVTALSYSGPHGGFSRLADETVHVCSGVEAIVSESVPFFELFEAVFGCDQRWEILWSRQIMKTDRFRFTLYSEDHCKAVLIPLQGSFDLRCGKRIGHQGDPLVHRLPRPCLPNRIANVWALPLPLPAWTYW